MPTTQVIQFIEKLETDQVIQHKIAEVEAGNINQICQIAADAGFKFTAAELKAEVERMDAVADEDTSNRQALIVGLTCTTAVIHVTLGTPLFILNGLGYLSLLAAHYASPKRETYRQHTRDALFGYTGFTVAGYFALKGTAGFADPTGVATKLVEFGLMRVLWRDKKAAQEQPSPILEAKPDIVLKRKAITEASASATA